MKEGGWRGENGGRPAACNIERAKPLRKGKTGRGIRGERISGILQQNPLILQAGFMARADGRNLRPEWGSLEGRILS
ncbi:MAG: hypothetical protein CW346_01830 [Bacillaceae bacterium]|nr:hypothetical protein [Bacillaceae bacterium]